MSSDDEPDAGGSELSRQARLLHELGVAWSVRTGSGGLIGRADAERLSDHAGALASELVEAGCWVETDVSYCIRDARSPASTRSVPDLQDGARSSIGARGAARRTGRSGGGNGG